MSSEPQVELGENTKPLLDPTREVEDTNQPAEQGELSNDEPDDVEQYPEAYVATGNGEVPGTEYISNYSRRTSSSPAWPASNDYFPPTGVRESWHDIGPDEIDIGYLAPPLPPDGGWGWMIVLGSFMCMVLVDGMCFSYGIFLSELEATFHASKMKMTLGGSLLTGCYLLMGPITSALANQFGFRRLIFAGAILSTSAIFLSSFIYNLDVFIVVFGIVGGIGYGLIYLPAVTVISLWFHRYRATATGIAVCGSGIGSAIYGFLLPFLIEKYTWRGCLLILAGISFNCAVAGALFRPLLDLSQPGPGGVVVVAGGSSTAAVDEESGANSRPESMSPDKKMQELVRRYAAQEAAAATGNVSSGGHRRGSNPERPGSITTSSIPENPAVQSQTSTAVSHKKKKKERKSKPKRYPKNSLMQRIIEGKQKEKARSVGSLDNMFITNDNDLIPVPLDYTDRPMISMNTINQIIESVIQKQDQRRAPDFRSRTSLHSTIKMRSVSSQHSQPCLVKDYVHPAGDHSVPNQHGASRRSSFFSSVVSLKPAIDRGSVIDEDTKTEIVNKLRKEMARPMHKKDVFYSGSMVHLQEFITAPEVKSYVKSVTSFQDTHADDSSPIRKAIRQMLDLSILKSPTFIMLVVSSIFSMVGFIVPFQFLKDNAQHLGFSRNTSSYLLSILGATNTVGRILAGFLSDRPWADCLWINNIALLVAGIATMLLPYCQTYAMLSLYACIYGIFIAAFVSLRSIIVVELIGLDNLTNAFGFLLLFQGIAIIIGPPILGSFYDLLQNYDYTFYLGGASLILSSVLCLPLRPISRWEARANTVVYESPSMDVHEESAM